MRFVAFAAVTRSALVDDRQVARVRQGAVLNSDEMAKTVHQGMHGRRRRTGGCALHR
jgi:hypothetical protein